jgi:hypothetical protein
MEARKKVRDRYIELLKQAKNMSEVLQVQNEINNTQVEVEGAAGRIACSVIHLPTAPSISTFTRY